jgi:predicted permease
MGIWSRARSLLRGLGSRAAVESEMDEELRFHVEQRTQHLIDSGMSPAESARHARVEFGSVESLKEQGRESRGLRLFDELRGDVRYGVRALLRSPGFTAIAVLTLTLGIGANTAVFSALDAVLLRPLPFLAPERLVELDDIYIPHRSTVERPQAAPEIRDAQALREVFTHVAAYAPGGLNLSGSGAPRRLNVAAVTTDFFSVLGVHPARGRSFTQEEGAPDGPGVAVVSDALWRTHLGGAEDLEARSITLNGTRYSVVGVMPRGFAFPEESEVWLPLSVPTTSASYEPFRQYLPSRMIARLAPGTSIEQARARVRALFTPYETADRPFETAAADLVQPLHSSLVGERRTALLVLLGATALVLLVACANVANLLLSRGAVRRREIAVRSALGATPARVLRQLMTESMLLAGIGGVLGIGLALAGVQLLDALVPATITGVAPVRIDARVLGFTVALALATGILFGLLPAFGARRTDAGEALKSGGMGAASGGQSARLRQAFVLAELGLAVMLLIGSALMLRSLHALLTTESGVDPEHVATLELSLANADYPDAEDRRRFYEQVLERIAALPQVTAAAVINELPMRGEGGIRFTFYPEGRPPEDFRDVNYYAQDLRVTPGYFNAMGIRVLLGRAPRPRPPTDTLGTHEVAINQALANLYWPGRNPIGQRMEMPGIQTYEVVGVVANVLSKSLESEVIPQAYTSLLDTPYDNAAIVARGSGSAQQLARLVEDAVHDVAPTQAVYNVRTMEQVMSGAIAPRRMNTLLITVFGVLALVLAGVGVYGVIGFSVARRSREIGIRLALGAAPRQVRWLVFREASVLALAGAALGLLGAWLLSRVLTKLMYGVTSTDPVAFAIAPVVLISVAALAALIPAQRATRMDPVRAIRTD